MLKHEFQFTAIIQSLENHNYLAEALFFPEITRFRTNAGATKDDLIANLARIVEEDLRLLELYRRRFTTAPVVAEAMVEVLPPQRSLAWRKPLALRFPYVHWEQGQMAHLAFVPALGIEILATSAEELHKQVPVQIHAHLLRTQANSTLGKLVWLQRCHTLEVETLQFNARVRTPKQIAVEEFNQFNAKQKKSVLSEVATNLTTVRLPEAYELNDIVERIEIGRAHV